METVERDYLPQGVQFYYIYKALAHPELNGYVTPFTLEERLMHVKEAERALGSRIPWLCDGMSNDVKHAFGNAPNCEFVVDPEGRVSRRRGWSNPTQLRKDLEELIGPVDDPTRVVDLDLPELSPPKTVAKGVVPRVQVPGRMRALKIEPLVDESKVPFYVKLRVEADRGFLDDGQGKLYLGFHLDPLYEVHWNNRTEPLHFEVTTPDGIEVTPAVARGPEIEESADADPREFLVDIRAQDTSEPLQFTVHYFACDDANTFCIPVTQKYRVHLEPDRDGGTTFSRAGGRGMDPSAMIRRMMSFDKNGDGILMPEELPPMLQGRFHRMDANGDGAVDQSEFEATAERMRRRFGGRRPG
ncbi:MAG: hypothetical protein ACE5G2_01510 [Candidatus Krumholzibacteriia bacterium]